MGYSLAGTVVKSRRNGINSCSSSNELGAQYAWPHQTSIIRKSHQTCKQEPALPVVMNVTSWSCSGEKIVFLVVQSNFTLKERQLAMLVGTTGTAGLREKRCRTVRPTVALYLNELITKLKCANSEVKSVHSHPQRGCLNWPYGTLSELP